MKNLYKVRVERLLAGKGEKYIPQVLNVVAASADVASAAAIAKVRDGFVEKLEDVRVEGIEKGEAIDLVAPAAAVKRVKRRSGR